MKLGILFDTIEADGRTHLAVTIIPSQEEYQEALEREEPGALWMEVFLKALQENSSGMHHIPDGAMKIQ